MRVLQFNCWFADEGYAWETRAPAMRAWIAHLKPDVICLQEVLRGLQTDGQPVDMLADLFRGTEYTHQIYGRASEFFFARAPAKHPLSVGNAIVSRWPITSHEIRPLPRFEDPTPRPTQPSRTSTDVGRSATWAQIQSPHGPISICCTHLNSMAQHGHNRLDQAVEVMSLINSKESLPASWCPVRSCGATTAALSRGFPASHCCHLHVLYIPHTLLF